MLIFKQSKHDCTKSIVVHRLSWHSEREGSGSDPNEQKQGYMQKPKGSFSPRPGLVFKTDGTGSFSVNDPNSLDPFIFCMYSESADFELVRNLFKGETYQIKDLETLVSIISRGIFDYINELYPGDVLGCQVYTDKIHYGCGQSNRLMYSINKDFSHTLNSGGLEWEHVFTKTVIDYTDDEKRLFADEAEVRIAILPIINEECDYNLIKIPKTIPISSDSLKDCFIKIT